MKWSVLLVLVMVVAFVFPSKAQEPTIAIIRTSTMMYAEPSESAPGIPVPTGDYVIMLESTSGETLTRRDTTSDEWYAVEGVCNRGTGYIWSGYLETRITPNDDTQVPYLDYCVDYRFDDTASPQDQADIQKGIEVAYHYGLTTNDITGGSFVLYARRNNTSDVVCGLAHPGTVNLNLEHDCWGNTSEKASIQIPAHEYIHQLQFKALNLNTWEGEKGPIWLLEGTAELMTYRAMAAAGIIDFNDIRQLQKSYARGQRLDLSTLVDYEAFQNGPATRYPVSFLAVELLVGHLEDNALLLYYQNIAAGQTPDEAFVNTFGQDLDTFYAAFESHQRNGYPRVIRNGIELITSSALNIRSGPGTDFEVIGGLGASASVVAVGRNADSTWFLLEDGGWVFGELVTPRGEVESLPVQE